MGNRSMTSLCRRLAKVLRDHQPFKSCWYLFLGVYAPFVFDFVFCFCVVTRSTELNAITIRLSGSLRQPLGIARAFKCPHAHLLQRRHNTSKSRDESSFDRDNKKHLLPGLVGLCVLVGIKSSDTPADAEYIIRKILNLRYL